MKRRDGIGMTYLRQAILIQMIIKKILLLQLLRKIFNHQLIEKIKVLRIINLNTLSKCKESNQELNPYVNK